MHRFFVPREWMEEQLVTVTGPQAHQIARVLRLQKGDEVILLDGTGWEHRVELLSVDGERVEGRVMQRILSHGEPRTKITLYQALLKGKKIENVLEKGTEVGIVAFVPVVSERCVVSSLEDIAGKYHRWQSIIQEAAEQSRRGLLPVLRPAMMLDQAWEEASKSGLAIVPWEEAGEGRSLRTVLGEKPNPPFAISLFIGPEGGFTPLEIAQGENYGTLPVTLGPRILRAETAGLVAAAAILHQLGDLG